MPGFLHWFWGIILRFSCPSGQRFTRGALSRLQEVRVHRGKEKGVCVFQLGHLHPLPACSFLSCSLAPRSRGGCLQIPSWLRSLQCVPFPMYTTLCFCNCTHLPALPHCAKLRLIWDSDVALWIFPSEDMTLRAKRPPSSSNQLCPEWACGQLLSPQRRSLGPNLRFQLLSPVPLSHSCLP